MAHIYDCRTENRNFEPEVKVDHQFVRFLDKSNGFMLLRKPEGPNLTFAPSISNVKLILVLERKSCRCVSHCMTETLLVEPEYFQKILSFLAHCSLHLLK